MSSWGKNWAGQLGNGTNFDKIYPVQIGTANNWASISAGTDHTIELGTDNSLWVWGRNWEGQWVVGTTDNKNSPIQIK